MTTRKNEDRREIAREIVRWVARLAPAIMVVLAAWHAYHAAPDGMFNVYHGFLALFLVLLAIFFLIALPEDDDR